MLEPATPDQPARPAQASGTGAGLLERVLHDRGVRLGAALAVAVSIPVAVVFYLQFRSLRDLETTSTLVLDQLSADAAERVVQALVRDFKAPHLDELSRAGIEADVATLDVAVLEPALREGLERHPFVRAFVVWSAGAAPGGRLLIYERPGGFRAPTEGERAIVDAVRAAGTTGRWPLLLQMPIRGVPHHASVRAFRDEASGDPSGFVGLLVDMTRFERDHLPRLIDGEIGRTVLPADFPAMTAAVLDASDRVVYRSAGSSPGVYAVERRFPVAFVDPDVLPAMRASGVDPRVEEWRLRVGYGPVAVPELVRARTTPQLVLMMALAGVMAAAVLLVAVSAAREVRLADLKSDFVSSVSHDLKTPLALIQLFAETLEVGRVRTPDRAQEYYRIINSEAQKLTRLINNILEFSRIEAGLRHYRMAPVDLADLAGKVLASLEHQFKQNRFEVTSALARDLPAISADAEAVARALENLLSNAMKYSSDAREIRVEVAAHRGAALVRVRDRGIGIPRRHQRRIFRKFYRVQDGNGLAAQGSGLGLAIVQHVMAAHKGAVHVESEPGRGSTFTLAFPMRGAAEYPEAGWP
jgi:signal transduction histidine kinase